MAVLEICAVTRTSMFSFRDVKWSSELTIRCTKATVLPGSYSTGRHAGAWGDYVHLHGHAFRFSALEIKSSILIWPDVQNHPEILRQRATFTQFIWPTSTKPLQ